MQTVRQSKKIHITISALILSLSFGGSVYWFMNPPIVTQGETAVEVVEYIYPGKHVIVNLTNMNIALQDGTTTVGTYPLLSQGKPGSYYETIGGVYENDYKIPLHFSSIGHVYMPYSVHVFGNYFIHGVPYYPNGMPVSSAYSGGCIRLTNANAKIVYDFIDKGTPIIITRDTEKNFDPTELSTSTMSNQIMTNYMVAAISLEALTQDNEILGTHNEVTTRRKLLPTLLNDNESKVSELYARSIGQDVFVDLMNQKAVSLGLSNTHFNDVTSPVVTTYEDYMRFMTYISTYKSYIRTIQNVDSGK
jgi:hypothetical protein